MRIAENRVACAECSELKRNLVRVAGEHNSLAIKARGRHISAPERRRLQQLRTQAAMARHELKAHQLTCKEGTP